MNILFIAYFPMEPSVGGIQRVTDILTHELIRKGHNVNYLSLQLGSTSPDLTTSAPQYYINVEEVGDWKSRIEELLEKLQIEYIINQSPNPLTNRALRSISTNAKIVSVFHTQPFLNDNVTRRSILQSKTYNFKQGLFKYISYILPLLRSKVFGHYENKNIIEATSISNKICFISERFYPRVLKHIPDFPKEKLSAINNPNTFTISRDTTHKENLIVWVGRIDNTNKNTIGFVKIWKLLYKSNPTWKAIVAGDGEDLESVKEYARCHKITNIEFIGRCDDVKSLYERAKFVVVTSFSESWCMVLTEGLAHGCVACAYDTYETVHDIIDGSNGIITEPNSKAMAERLNSIMNNNQEYKMLTDNTKKTISKYSVETIVDKWIELLSSI